jgi:Asp-tRNA(Asn)/Glu-tRNA(Gln) amidotransferase A subunit family amidase
MARSSAPLRAAALWASIQAIDPSKAVGARPAPAEVQAMKSLRSKPTEGRNRPNPGSEGEPVALDRRQFVRLAAAMAAAGAVGIRTASAQERQQASAIAAETLAQAEKIAGIEFTAEEREAALRDVRNNLRLYEGYRELNLGNAVPPAVQFQPWPGGTAEALELMARANGGAWPAKNPIEVVDDGSALPSSDEDIAFLPVARLAAHVRAGRLSPVRLTDIYIERLNRIGPTLQCVVTMMEESARREAREAEAEIRAGRSEPYKDQIIDDEATVVTKLREAGAILVVKLTLGALAMGDNWFGGRTRNPWDTDSGSSGSSAGPASAVAAGLVGFGIGTETRGSIVSPSKACGNSSLRPTFGRVSRHGAMTVSWSMDKIGPMCRSIEDCALVFNEIHGADGKDSTSATFPFEWRPSVDWSSLRVGFVESEFGGGGGRRGGRGGGQQAELNQAALEQFRALGADPRPIELPRGTKGADIILNVEATAAFDDLTRSNRDDLMVANAQFWPPMFRSHRFVPAVEYLQANRARTLLMREMAESMREFDLFISPGGQLGLTNLTGHPSVVFPVGFDGGRPRAIALVGDLYKDDLICAAAHAYQRATDWHKRRPSLAF